VGSVCVYRKSYKEFLKLPAKQKKFRFSNGNLQKFRLFSRLIKADKAKSRNSRKKRGFFLSGKSITLALALCLCLGLSAAILKIGIRGEFLAEKIQETLTQKLGTLAQTEIGDVRLFLDENFRIAIEARNVSVHPLQSDIKIDRINRIRIGFSTRGLINRKFKIAQIELQDAEIFLSHSDDQTILDYLPVTQSGQIDFDAVSDALFASINHLLEGLDSQATKSLVLEDILLRYQTQSTEQILSIAHLEINNLKRAMILKGQLEWNGQLISLDGRIDHDGRKQGQTFSIAVNNVPVHLGAKDGASPYLADGRSNNAYFKMLGAANIYLQGTAAYDDKPQTVSASFSMPLGYTDISTEERIETRFAFEAAHQVGRQDIEILPSEFTLGALNIPFHGVIGPLLQGDDKADVSGKYRFALESDNGVSAPQESSEAALQFGLKLAGQFKPEEKQAVFDQIQLKTTDGSLLGQGSLKFGEGSPETIFLLRIPKMPVDEAKQLWPINVARSTRLWVLSHVFGGELADSTIEVAFPGGFFKPDRISPLLTEREIKIKANLKNVRSDIIGKIPALREGSGSIFVKGTTTEIRLKKGIAYVGNNEPLNISEGVMFIPWVPFKPLFADLSVRIHGQASSIGKLVSYAPADAAKKIPFDVKDMSGDISILLKMNFPMAKNAESEKITWDAWVDFDQFSLATPYQGTTTISNAAGSTHINSEMIELKGDGLLNGIPASIEISLPFLGDDTEKQEKIVFHFDDETRNRFVPALKNFLTGMISIDVGQESDGKRHLVVDLSKAVLEIPWIGWKKGNGVAAKAEMTVPADIKALKDIKIDDFNLSGDTFQINGQIVVKDGNFISGDFSKVILIRNDNLRLSVKKTDKTYHIKLTGKYFDARSLIKRMGEATSPDNSNEKIELTAQLDKINGFYEESLTNFKASYRHDKAGNDSIILEGVTSTEKPVLAKIIRSNGEQTVNVSSDDAGSLLRLMNLYDKLHGGHLEAKLQSIKEAPLSGPVSITNFQIIDEPKLASIVSTSPSGGGKSLNEAVKGKIDLARVVVDHAFGQIGKGDNYFVLDRGVIRGPTVGATFQGIVYDASGNTAITGTFMPGYGLNRLFANVPVLGAILGNGRDRGLIGITFKVEGKAQKPRIVVNPISVIAPGIFRSIFEFK